MAYPFSRTPSGLRTPEALKGYESPHTQTRSLSLPFESRPSRTNSRYARKLTIFLLAVTVFGILWSANHYRASSARQTDRIPFTHSVAKE